MSSQKKKNLTEDEVNEENARYKLKQINIGKNCLLGR